jgi:hypothetical protein
MKIGEQAKKSKVSQIIVALYLEHYSFIFGKNFWRVRKGIEANHGETEETIVG